MAYSIKVTPNYYSGTCNAPQEEYLTWRGLAGDPDCVDNSHPDDIAKWDTEVEAQAVIDDIIGDGPYYLSHGEAGAPSYEIVEDFDDDNDDCQDTSGLDIDGFAEIDEYDLSCEVKDRLDKLNVQYHRSGDDYDVYTAGIIYQDTRYMIAFCPTTTALQINSDDLGCLDWDKAAYFREV